MPHAEYYAPTTRVRGKTASIDKGLNDEFIPLEFACLLFSCVLGQKTKEQNKSCWCRQRDVCDVMHGLNLQWGSVMQLRQSWLVNSNATSNFTKGASLCTYSYKWAGNNCKKARRKEALRLSDKFKSFFHYINKLKQTNFSYFTIQESLNYPVKTDIPWAEQILTVILFSSKRWW